MFVVGGQRMVSVIEVDRIFDRMIEVFEGWEMGDEKRMEELKGGPYYLFYKGRKEGYAHCLGGVYGSRRSLLEIERRDEMCGLE